MDDTNKSLFHLAAGIVSLVLNRDEDAAQYFNVCRQHGIKREEIREAILQTYLFDGYPTALEGFFVLNEIWPEVPDPTEIGDYVCWKEWRERGIDLYSRVYGEVAGKLQEKARNVSPELANWMLVEGYGKTLSRSGLNIQSRELLVIAVLVVKRRPKQLFSHIRGSLRVGVSTQTIKDLIDFLEEIFKLDDLDSVRELLDKAAESR